MHLSNQAVLPAVGKEAKLHLWTKVDLQFTCAFLDVQRNETRWETTLNCESILSIVK